MYSDIGGDEQLMMAQPRSRSCMRNRWFTVGCMIVTLLIVGLLIAIIVLAVKLNHEKGKQTPKESISLLEYYQLRDGINLRWFPHANSQEDLSNALKGEYDIIETDLQNVSLQQGVVPLGDQDSQASKAMTIPFEVWVKQVGGKPNTGMKLNLDPDSDIAAVYETLEKYNVRAPVILSLPYPVYKNGELQSNISRFFSLLSQRHWNFPLIASVDLSPLCCQEPIGDGTIEYLWEKFKPTDLSVNVEINAKQWDTSWSSLAILLERSNSTTITISEDGRSDKGTAYDQLLLVRNDIDIDRAFYKVSGTTLARFKDLVSTAGSPLLYFDIKPRDAGKIIWSHNTDTWELLHEAVNGPAMMVEADLRLKDNIPIMAHDKGDDNNLTFSQWLDEIIKVDKGMKLDFKELEAMVPALQIVSNKTTKIKGPIWVNADIVKGPYGGDVTMIPSVFLENVKTFPHVTLSIGWTTGAKDSRNMTYTMEMMREIHELSKNLSQPITFPCRASLMRVSWNVFDWLLKQSRAYTLTIWTSPMDQVRKEDMDFIKRQTEPARVYFDLPEELRPFL